MIRSDDVRERLFMRYLDIDGDLKQITERWMLIWDSCNELRKVEKFDNKIWSNQWPI